MMNRIDRRRFLQMSSALGGFAALGGPSRAWAQANKLVVNTYGGRWEKFWRSDMLPQLKAQTGIDPTVDVGVGRTVLTNMRTAGIANPQYSVIMVNENMASQVRAEGYFEPISAAQVPNLADVYPNLRNDGNNGVRGIVSAIGLAYRKDLVKTPPTSWTDLWTNPEFKGKIGLYQISNTAATLFLLMTAKIYGGSPEAIDRAFVEVKKLMPFAQVDWSGTLATLMTRGDVTVAMIDFPEVVALQEKGVPVEMVIPKEGVVAFEQSFNILKNAPAKDAAYKYLNFILDPTIQEHMAKEFYTSPTNQKTVVPAALAGKIPVHGDKMASLTQFDWSKVNPRVPEITDRWEREMK